jgi:hypothetical protein
LYFFEDLTLRGCEIGGLAAENYLSEERVAENSPENLEEGGLLRLIGGFREVYGRFSEVFRDREQGAGNREQGTASQRSRGLLWYPTLSAKSSRKDGAPRIHGRGESFPGTER